MSCVIHLLLMDDDVITF